MKIRYEMKKVGPGDDSEDWQLVPVPDVPEKNKAKDESKRENK